MLGRLYCWQELRRDDLGFLGVDEEEFESFLY
jgi:hypothetical protein